MKNTLLIFCLLIFFHNQLSAQCPVQAFANPSTIYCGESVSLSAKAEGCKPLNNNFNSGVIGPDWQSTNGAVVQNGTGTYSCVGAPPEGTFSLWMGATVAAPRQIRTNNYNLTSCGGVGGTICFYLKFGVQQGASPCEGIDLKEEAVELQYTTNNGASWTTIRVFDINQDPSLTGWKQYCVDIPAAAFTASTGVRWYQASSSGAGFDAWGLDDLVITLNGPGYTFDWVHDAQGPQPTSATPTLNPTTTTTYTVNYTNGVQSCSSNVTVTVISPTVTATATPNTVCAGAPVVLDVTSSLTATPPTSCGTAPVACNTTNSQNIEVQLGTGTNLSETANGGISYLGCSNNDGAVKSQFLLRASNLIAGGLQAGKFTNMQFDVASNDLGTQGLQNCEISFMCTNLTNLPGNFVATGTATVVYTPKTLSVGSGWVTVFFDNGFNWDGASNIIITICWRLPQGANGATIRTRHYASGYTSASTAGTNTAGGGSWNCATSTSFFATNTMLPNFKFGMCVPRPNNFNYTWTSSPAGFNSSVKSPTANPNTTTTYTVSALLAGSPAGCAVTANTSVTVVSPTVTIAPKPAFICSGSTSVNLSGTANVVAGTKGTYTFTGDPNPNTAVPDNGAAITNTIAVSGVNPNTLGSSPILNVKLNMTHPNTGDLIIRLISPAGTSYILSNRRGTGANYTNTVFTATGTDPAITGGASPFTGNFTPETALSSITGAVNGNWQISVQDVAKPALGNSAGTFNDWSISFTADNSIVQYTWTPATNLSSTTTANTTASPTSTATYTLTVRDAVGCTNTDNVTVTVSAPITPTFAALTPVCVGDVAPTLNTTSTNATPINGTWNPATFSTATAGTFTSTFTPAAGQCATSTTLSLTVNAPVAPTIPAVPPFCTGTTAPNLPNPTNTPTITGTWNPNAISNTMSQTYTFTPAAGQCATTATLSVTVNPAPPATFTQIPPFCSGTAAPTLPTSSNDSPAINGTWTTLPVSNTATGTYTFTPTAGQCATSTTMTITVTPSPQATFNPITPFCAGSASPVLPLTSTNSPAITGTWSPNVIDNMNSGTYTFTPDAGQCGTSNTLSVTILPQVVPTFNPIPQICSGDPAPTLPTSSTNSPAITGTWATLPVSNTATGTYTFTPAASECATTATITVTVGPPVTPTFNAVGPFCSGDAVPAFQNPSIENISGTWSSATINNTASATYTFTPAAGVCATTASLSVVINPKQTPTLGAIAPFCVGTTAPALPVSSTDAPPVTGSWNPTTIDNTTSGTFVFTFTPDAGQCYATTTLSVTITPAPTPTFTAIGPFCSGDAVPALQNPSNEAIQGVWNPGTIDNTTSGTYTFTPNAGQCGVSTTFSVVVNPKPTPTFDPVPPLCAGDPTPTLQLPSNEGINGSWLPATVNNTVTATYTFTPAAGVCAETASIIITVGPPQPPVFTQISPFCSGTTPIPTLPTTSTNGVTGSWTPALVSNTASGNYVFTPNPGICAETTDMNIIVNAKSNPTFAAVGPYCKGDVIPALNTSSNEGTTGSWGPAIDNQNTTTYTFTPSTSECANTTTLQITINPATTPLFSPVTAFCAGSPAPTLPTTSNNTPGIVGSWSPGAVDNMATGTYTFSPNAGQCAESTVLTVTVNSGVTVTVPPATTCANVGVVLTASGASTYTWSPSTGLSSTTGANVTATVPATTTYTCTGDDGNGCTGTTTVTVTIASGLTITVNPASANICNGGDVSLTASGATTYTWSPALGLNTTSGATVVANPTTTTTYTVDGNTNGCIGSTTVVVNVGAPIPATFNPVPSFCTSDTPPSLPATSIEGFTGTWMPSSVNTAANTTYTFTPTPTLCASSGSLTINVNPTPVLGTVTEQCDGTNTNYTVTVTINGGTAPYTMTGQAPAGITGTFAGNVWTSNPIPSGAAYDFDFDDANGCGPIDVTGQKNCNCSSDVGTMTGAALSLCATQTATATYSSAGEVRDADDQLEYVLHTNSGGTLGTILMRSATPTFSFGAPLVFGTTYYISAIVGSNNGTGGVDETDPCLAVATGQSVIWNATPTATASNNGPLCLGATLNLTGGVTLAGANYTWTYPNGTTVSQQSPSVPNVTAADGGVYSLTVSANGCSSAPATTTVVITPTPVASPASNSPICAGSTLNLTNPTAGATYAWSGPNNFTATSQNPNVVNATTAFSGAFQLIVTVNGCASAPVVTNVVVNPIPVISVNPNAATICAGASTNLSASNSQPGTTTYAWSPATGLNTTAGAVVTASPQSTITYTVVGTDPVGCAANATVTVTVDPIPVITPITDIPVCAGNQVNVPAFNVTPAGGTTNISWSTTNGTSIGMPKNADLGNIPPFLAAGTVGTQVNVIVKASRNGCNALDENFLIQVNPLPVVSIDDVSFVCEGSTLVLTAQPGGLTPDNTSYTWTLPDNSQLSGNYANVNNTTQAHTGSYRVDVIAGGCLGTATRSFTITPPIDPVLDPIGPFCENIAALTPLTSSVLGSWTGSGVVNGNTFQPSTALPSTNTLTFTPQMGVCANSGTIDVVVNPMPIIAPITGGTGCGPLSVTFSPFNAAGFTTIDFGNGTSSNVTLPTISNIYSNSGYYDVTVTQTTNGCTTAETFTDIVYVEPNPIASFSAKNSIVYLTDPRVELDNNSTGAVSYDWDFGDNLSSTINNPTHTYEERAATYTITLVATSDAGCIDETTQTIQVKDELLFFSPNTFTPDGDQHNNTFQPVFTSGFDPQNFTMVIYNRWGQIIFETHNAEIGWDGTYQGTLVQEGIYSWTMDMKDPNSDNKYNFQGHILLVR